MVGSHTVLSSIARGRSGIGVYSRHDVMIRLQRCDCKQSWRPSVTL
jgi:hypothetical protein